MDHFELVFNIFWTLILTHFGSTLVALSAPFRAKRDPETEYPELLRFPAVVRETFLYFFGRPFFDIDFGIDF